MNENELLLTSILNCKRSDLYSSDLLLGPEQSARFFLAKRRRAKRVPLQYILGEVEFYGLPFKVDERVFIPRPETEILVEEAIRLMMTGRSWHTKNYIEILDIGTGSGCIAVALAKNITHAHVAAVDISYGALDVSGQNAKLNGVSERIDFIQSNLFSQLDAQITHTSNNSFKLYDVIISNPPYIASDDLDSLQEEVKSEPRLALDGGRDGLDFYRLITRDAHRFLKNRGLLLLEIGFGQASKIRDILRESGNFKILDTVKDYSGIERIILAENIN